MRVVDARYPEFRGRCSRQTSGRRSAMATTWHGGIGNEVGQMAYLADHARLPMMPMPGVIVSPAWASGRLRNTRKCAGCPHVLMNAAIPIASAPPRLLTSRRSMALKIRNKPSSVAVNCFDIGRVVSKYLGRP